MDALRLVKCVVSPVVSKEDVIVFGEKDPFSNKVFRAVYFFFNVCMLLPFIGAAIVLLVNKIVTVLKKKDVPEKLEMESYNDAPSSILTDDDAPSSILTVGVSSVQRTCEVAGLSHPSLSVSEDFKRTILDFFHNKMTSSSWIPIILLDMKKLHDKVNGHKDLDPWYLGDWKVLNFVVADNRAKANLYNFLCRGLVKSFASKGKEGVLEDIEYSKKIYGTEVGFRAYCHERGLSTAQTDQLLKALKTPNISTTLFFEYLLMIKKP